MYGIPIVDQPLSSNAETADNYSKTGFKIKGPIHVRAHLEDVNKPQPELALNVFEAAFREYFKCKGYYCSATEIASIIATFKNLVSGKISMIDLDMYIDLHKGTCTLHGRNVCGTCFYYKECQFGQCDCTYFSPIEGNEYACIHCSHSSTLHRKYPLQCKTGGNFRGLKTILVSSKRPDMEIPAAVGGISSLAKALYPIANPTKEIRKNSHTLSELVSPNKNSVAMTLSEGRLLGEEVAQSVHTLDYWDQRELSMSINHSSGMGLLGDYGITVLADPRPPDIDLDKKPGEFWKNVSKHANKGLRDYNEKFKHNVPLPIVVNGEMVYTLEGSKVYLMILCRLLYLGEQNLIGSDDGDMIRLVVDHAQIFERHWRKMVVDIRQGKSIKTSIISR